jgi:hypothetical protein
MPQSIKERTQVGAQPTLREMNALLQSILVDLTALRTLLNTHVHSGVTAGGANTGVTTVTAAALDLRA